MRGEAWRLRSWAKVAGSDPGVKELEKRGAREAAQAKAAKKRAETKAGAKVEVLEKTCELYRNKAAELADYE